MELTPIKVRGKRRAQDELAVAPPPKRPQKDPSVKKDAKARRPKFSNLEKSMPLEVLEHIFWLSENVNFPRASLRLGRLLSGAATLRGTFLSAFGPTWDKCFSLRGRQHIVVHIDHSVPRRDKDEFPGNPDFQTVILRHSWVTIDVILDCWDIWVRRNAREDLAFEYTPLWGHPTDPAPYADSSVTIGATNIKEARFYFYQDYYTFRNIEDDTMKPITQSCYPHWVEVHICTEIPDNLITGPWDEPSLQKFFWLVRGGARLARHQTWETTHRGFYNAVTANPTCPNLTALRLLHLLDAFNDWPPYIKQDELSKSLAKKENLPALRWQYYYISEVLKF
ncbi:hypothetical protein F5B22DRAFT_543927 [Xylaria bambusicola]|uniref:uncharacterized protein n=1 Tax=Xylaria bambusicola TaxID=326684 RepID=UPI00200798F8|nr:uncharacterized protein F5B22DRAFT_543927 [Xylaria bambusicola]KAI0521582.1 hypothetical protein F5B22DRAFT_543927 [Xylaria bambusicola]